MADPQPLLQPEYYTPPPLLPTRLAVATMVCGIVSLPLLLCFWPLSLALAFVAVLLGTVARQQVHQGLAGGGGMAMAGIVCGSVTVSIGVLVMVSILS